MLLGAASPSIPKPIFVFLVESSQQQQQSPLHSPPAVVESSSIRSREGSSSPSPSWIRRRRPLSAAHRGGSNCAVARRPSAPSWPHLPPPVVDLLAGGKQQALPVADPAASVSSAGHLRRRPSRPPAPPSRPPSAPPVAARPRHLPASACREQRPPACAAAIFSPRRPSSAARPPAVAAPPPRLHLRSSGRGKRGCCIRRPSRPGSTASFRPRLVAAACRGRLSRPPLLAPLRCPSLRRLLQN